MINNNNNIIIIEREGGGRGLCRYLLRIYLPYRCEEEGKPCLSGMEIRLASEIHALPYFPDYCAG